MVHEQPSPHDDTGEMAVWVGDSSSSSSSRSIAQPTLSAAGAELRKQVLNQLSLDYASSDDPKTDHSLVRSNDAAPLERSIILALSMMANVPITTVHQAIVKLSKAQAVGLGGGGGSKGCGGTMRCEVRQSGKQKWGNRMETNNEWINV